MAWNGTPDGPTTTRLQKVLNTCRRLFCILAPVRVVPRTLEEHSLLWHGMALPSDGPTTTRLQEVLNTCRRLFCILATVRVVPRTQEDHTLLWHGMVLLMDPPLQDCRRW